jgi:hypothetical protein
MTLLRRHAAPLTEKLPIILREMRQEIMGSFRAAVFHLLTQQAPNAVLPLSTKQNSRICVS